LSVFHPTVLITEVGDEDIHQYDRNNKSPEDDGNSTQRKNESIVIDSTEDGPVVHVSEHIDLVPTEVQRVVHQTGAHVKEYHNCQKWSEFEENPDDDTDNCSEGLEDL
jgi:hypothetical protein